MKPLMQLAFRAGFYRAALRYAKIEAYSRRTDADQEFDSWFTAMGGEDLITIIKQINKD